MPFIHILSNTLLIIIVLAVGIASRKRKRVSYTLMVVALSVAFLGYFLPSRPDILTKVFPFADIVFYSNLYPPAVALLAPLALQLGKSRFHKIRIGVLLTVLFAASLLPYRYFHLPPAETAPQTTVNENGVCRQTSIDTCSAAAVVTLLRQYGIDATESKVAELALTKKDRGTWVLGQYRALRCLTEGSDAKLKVRIRKLPADELIASRSPAIITVGLQENPKTVEEKKLAERYQWTPGVMHDVVFLGLDEEHPDKVRIGEPDLGLERWWVRELRILYQGYAILLEPAT